MRGVGQLKRGRVRGAGRLTVDDHPDGPEVDLSARHDAGLARVGALVRLLDAADLEVVVGQDLKADWNQQNISLGLHTTLTQGPIPSQQIPMETKPEMTVSPSFYHLTLGHPFCALGNTL